MSPLVPRRPDLAAMAGYHSPQVDVDVRLNTNESPYSPPERWLDELAQAVRDIDYHRYPDREVRALRTALAERHGVAPDEVFCANGSDEVLQCLLLAFGGPGRRAAVFEPTYRLHSHIARVTGTEVVTGGRTADFRIDPVEADRLLAEHRPEVTFLCSPNNPTGRSDSPELVAPTWWPTHRAWWWWTRPTASSPRGRRSRCGREPAPRRPAWWWSAPSPRRGPWPPCAWVIWWPTGRWSPAARRWCCRTTSRP